MVHDLNYQKVFRRAPWRPLLVSLRVHGDSPSLLHSQSGQTRGRDATHEHFQASGPIEELLLQVDFHVYREIM